MQGCGALWVLQERGHNGRFLAPRSSEDIQNSVKHTEAGCKISITSAHILQQKNKPHLCEGSQTRCRFWMTHVGFDGANKQRVSF